jgi:hypothetical protein
MDERSDGASVGDERSDGASVVDERSDGASLTDGRSDGASLIGVSSVCRPARAVRAGGPACPDQSMAVPPSATVPQRRAGRRVPGGVPA